MEPHHQIVNGVTPADLDLLLNQSRDALVMLDDRWCFRYVNDRAVAGLGKSRERLLGASIWALFPDLAGGIFYEEAHRAMRDEAEVAFQAYDPVWGCRLAYRLVPAPGRLMVATTELSGRPVADSSGDGETTARVEAHRRLEAELAERRRTEEALRDHELAFTTLANSIPQLAWMADADGWIFWYNQRWYDYTGTTLEEVEGWGWQKVHHPEHLRRVVARIRRAFERGEPWEDTFPLRSEDGTYRWFLSRALPIRDREGRVVRWFGTNTDVTEIRAMEEELRASESRFRHLAERLRTILDVLPVAVFIADAEGRLTDTNEAARVLWGGETPLVHESEFHLFKGWWADTGERLAARDWAMARALRGQSVARGEEVEIETFDGVRKVILNHAQPILVNGGIDGAVAVSIDITTLRETEKALRELNATLERRVEERTAALEKRNRELQSFAYVASHDLREPLRKIQTFAGLMQADHGAQLSGEALLFLERMQSAAARMQQLLDDLLAYSRVATRPQPFVRARLQNILDDVCSDLDIAIAQAGAHIETDADVYLDADPSQLRQLLNNLILNAIKFRKDDAPPRIRVTASVERDGAEGSAGAVCRIAVEDNGIGFDPKYAERIFEPFQRLHGRSAYAGSGMGLAIVQRIVERHCGRVEAESTPGEGSRFIVRLPVRQVDEP